MKRARAATLLRSTVVSLLLTFSLSSGTPSRFNLFQGNAYSGSPPRQRNKNWCAFVVHRNVTCAVLAGTESVVEPERAPCPMSQPECAQRVMYRAHLRPLYKLGYKLVTELEWRCCPGFQGQDCQEPREGTERGGHARGPRPNLPPLLYGPRPNPPNVPPAPAQEQSMLGLEQLGWQAGHPWVQTGQGGGPAGQAGAQGGSPAGQAEGGRVQQLEEEVSRLSQTVLDLTVAMTASNAALRRDLQEDASRMLLDMLGNLQQQPHSALTGGTESILLNFDLTSPAEELQSKLTHLTHTLTTNTDRIQELTHTLATNTHTVEDLKGRVQRHDGQLSLLMEAAPGAPPAPPPTPASCQTYVDERIDLLRDELMQGMDIKMADLKNACDYKVISLQEQCEFQESSSLSLAELLESKESDLRREILELRLLLPTLGSALGSGSGVAEVTELRAEVARLATELERQNRTLGEREEEREEESERQREEEREEERERQREEERERQREATEARVSLAQRNAELLLLVVEQRLSESFERALNSSHTTHTLALDTHQRSLLHLQDRLTALETICNPVVMDTLQAAVNGQAELSLNLSQSLVGLEGEVGPLTKRVAGLQGEVGPLMQRVVGLEGEVSPLMQRMEGLESSVSGLNHSVTLNSLELQRLNSTHAHIDPTDWSEAESDPAGVVGLQQRVCGERVAKLEGVCGRLEPMADSLRRIRDGLNTHVSSLWSCVSQLNATLRTHTRDISAFRAHTHTVQAGLDGTTGTPGVPESLESSSVPMETGPRPASPARDGEWGGGASRHQTLVPPHQGTNGSMTPVKGYAGAPGYPPLSPVALTPNILSAAHIPLETMAQLPVLTANPVAFSAGLTLLPFPGQVGIIRFNKLLLNDGGHYDPHTGMFSAPVDGRYLLSAVVTAQKEKHVEAVLSVANRSIQRIDTSGSGGVASDGCVCGGSASLSLILDMRRGEKAGLVMTSGKLALSASSEILSSFSAVLLYSTPEKR